MSNLFRNNRNIVLVFNANKSHDKKCRAAALSLDKNAVTIDISKAKVGAMDWLKIVEYLGIHVEDLINKDHPDFLELYQSNEIDLDDTSALKILHSHAEVLKFPIAIQNGHALLLKYKNEIYKLEDFEEGEGK